MHERCTQIINLYDRTRHKKNEMAKLPQEDRDIITNAKRDANIFVDALIQMLNDELDEKEVTVASPKRLKYEYLRQLVGELDSEYANDSQMLEMVSQS